jgi:ABC-type glycerol-3-phosphate transport system permease component
VLEMRISLVHNNWVMHPVARVLIKYWKNLRYVRRFFQYLINSLVHSISNVLQVLTVMKKNYMFAWYDFPYMINLNVLEQRGSV